MCEKAVLSLDGNLPDADAVFCFLTIIFGETWPIGWEEKFREFMDLVYAVTRQAGITIYQDTETGAFLRPDRSYIAEFDKTCDKWLIIVARGEEYVGAIDALRFISQSLPASVQ